MSRWLFLLVLLFGVAACSSSDGIAVGDEDVDDISGGDVVQAPVDGVDAETEDLVSPPDVQPAVCKEGTPCDDGLLCTYDDRCTAFGGCAGLSYECDDGRTCTGDVCDGLGGCEFPIGSESCLIGNICYVVAETVEGNACSECDPAISQVAWSEAAVVSCDDGDFCTDSDQCEGGICVGVVAECDDGNPCTEEHCDPLLGCVVKSILGDCDDGNACTEGDQCDNGGNCVGVWALVCLDENECTEDGCDVLTGCTFLPIEGECSDGDVCTVVDVCANGQCTGGPPNGCNDGNSCTDDACDPGMGCLHSLNDNPCCTNGTSFCDDGNPCTEDLCDPITSVCEYLDYEGLCNDGDPCTQSDQCTAGECAGEEKSCDDANSCTVDACGDGGGCSHDPQADGTLCDDGQECSVADVCDGGICSGDESACQCQPTFSPSVNKVVSMAIGQDGTAGQALDVDGDPTTCAPPESCENGLDNALSLIAGFVNDSLEESINGGTIILLFEHSGYSLDEGTYQLNFYVGEVGDPTCDVQAAICSYLVDPQSFDEDCKAIVSLSNATIIDNVITAGGPGMVVPLSLPLAGGVLDLSLYNVRIEGQAVIAEDQVVAMGGILAGAVRKDDLSEALAGFPPESLPAGLDLETIISLLDLLVLADIDTDGDGVNDAASVGFPFTTLPGKIAGLVQ